MKNLTTPLVALAFAVSMSFYGVNAGAGEPACCSAEEETAASAAASCCAQGGEAKATAANASSAHGAQAKGHGGQSKGLGGQAKGHGGQAKGHGDQAKGHGGHGVMQGAHALINNHAAIVRSVEEIPGGIRSVTTTDDAAVLAVLQKHPGEMYAHLDNGGFVRRGDPLFRELASVQDQIDVEIRMIENGVEVISTSADENVAKLIRLHAAKVSEFVASGHAAMRGHTPLPADYVRPEDVTATTAGGACCEKGMKGGQQTGDNGHAH